MAITYGFFNSVEGDRKYNADQMSEYFDGLISNGIYEDVGGALQVKAIAGGGMAVNVETGRGIIDCKWINNSSVLTLDITAAHVTLNRYTAIVMRLDNVNRLMEITTKDGTAASTPVKPAMQNDATMTELCLAYIYIAASATSISQADIEDTRPTNLCGWITGLIDQVDTSELFIQYQTAWNNYYNTMTAAFNAWFESLVDDLNVNTFIQQFTKRVVMQSSAENMIMLDMTGYSYDSSDIIHIYINGLLGVPNVDYVIDTLSSVPIATIAANAVGTDVYIEVLKSKIGFTQLTASNGNPLTFESGVDIDI